jgi:hypothetical protein
MSHSVCKLPLKGLPPSIHATQYYSGCATYVVGMLVGFVLPAYVNIVLLYWTSTHPKYDAQRKRRKQAPALQARAPVCRTPLNAINAAARLCGLCPPARF